jgi:hypothetical protein
MNMYKSFHSYCSLYCALVMNNSCGESGDRILCSNSIRMKMIGCCFRLFGRTMANGMDSAIRYTEAKGCIKDRVFCPLSRAYAKQMNPRTRILTF